MKLIRKVKLQISKQRYLLLYLQIFGWLLFQTGTSFGQTTKGTTVATENHSVSGKVTDSSKAPIPGVSVYLKGTTIGTITDADGVYSLKNAPANGTLTFSFVGMKNQELPISDRSVINVALEEESVDLQEVVAVGYGTQKKKDLTGSISRVSMGGKEMAAITDISGALQGSTPGLNATAGSNAGEAGSLSIRGKTSLSASDSPLIVVDGIIYNGSIADINVSDIETIDVLKDASSASVYGSRSANGVIAITTKRGSSEKPKINFNSYFGLQDLSNTDKTDVMNGDQYAVRLVDYYYQQSVYNWYKTNPTSADARPVRPDVTNRELVATYLRTEEEQNNYLNKKEVNWVDEVFRVAPVQNYNLSISGKSEKSNYYISTSYLDQQGILLNDKFKRLTFMSRFESKITDWLTIEFNPLFSHRDYSGLNVSADYALLASPLGNKIDGSGNYPVYIAGESYAYHPLGNMLVTDSQPRDNVNLVLKGKVNIPWIKGLKYEVNYSQSYLFSRGYRYIPTSVADGSKVDGSAEKNNSTEKKELVNNMLTYDKIFKNDHRLNITLLQSYEETNGEGTVASAIGFQNETLGYNAIELGTTQTVSSSGYKDNTISYMGRINYTYKDRYLLTATVRRDGYSGFGKNTKFGNFPSASLGWVASEENFLKEVKAINFLKLRASYGINGNQGIGRYASQSTMSSTSTVFDGGTSIGLYASTLGNADLGWEKTASLNAGLDIKILDNRISASVDAYKAKTTDVLVQQSLPTTTGYSNVWTNIGGIENRGIEASLTTENIRNSKLSWRSTFAFSIVRNKITKLYNNITEDLGNSWFVGHSINSIYGYKNIGVWQEADLFNKTIISGYYPGQFKIQDLNDDGAITADKDRKIIGSSDPNYRISLNNELAYKNFSLTIFLNSIQGGNGYYISSNNGSLVAGGTDYAYRLNRTAVRAYWRPDAPVNNAPAMYYNPKIDPGIYQSKSFIRLQDVTLAYTFDKKFLNAVKLDNLKLYVSGKNLYTWTKWSGWDPETNAPMIRSVIGGINISF